MHHGGVHISPQSQPRPAQRHGKAAGAIVLGARIQDDGTASPLLKRRLLRASKLWSEGVVDVVIVSGGVTQSARFGSESAIMQKELCALGVPHEVIAEEDCARNTRENALYGLALAKRLGLSRLVIVTDYGHLPRAWMVFAVLRWRLQRHTSETTGYISLRGRGASLLWKASTVGFLLREGLALLADAIRVWRFPLR